MCACVRACVHVMHHNICMLVCGLLKPDIFDHQMCLTICISSFPVICIVRNCTISLVLMYTMKCYLQLVAKEWLGHLEC